MEMLKQIKKILENRNFTTKVYLYFSSRSAGDAYDKYEQNWTYTNMNPMVIKALVREVSPEALIYKHYGLENLGSKEILCEKKYKSWFENCNKIEIDSKEYQVFKEGTGQRTLIMERPTELIKVIVTRKGD